MSVSGGFTVIIPSSLGFSGNEELFKERDQKDDEFLDRLKEFKIDSTDPQSEKVRKPNNEG